MRITTAVDFDLDKDGIYSKNIKVQINSDDQKKTLGILSEEDSASMLPFLDNGRDDVFEGRICFIDKNIESENKRIKIVVNIANKNSSPQSANDL